MTKSRRQVTAEQKAASVSVPSRRQRAHLRNRRRVVDLTQPNPSMGCHGVIHVPPSWVERIVCSR